MNLNQLRLDALDLCRKVAPLDLDGQAVYVLLQSALPPDRGGNSICGGYTAANLDLYLHDLIPEWTGRGFACVINDAEIEAAHPNVRDVVFNEIVLHELAHALAGGWRTRWDDQPEPDVIQRDAAKCAAYVADPEMMDPPRQLPFVFHEGPFVRCCAHLAYRANRLGYTAALFCMVPFSFYGLSSATKYETAIADEPAGMLDLSFRDILATPPPSAFAALWQADLSYWCPVLT